MNDNDSNEEVRVALDNIKTWLANRPVREDHSDTIDVRAPEGLRSIGFADLNLDKAGPEHSEGIVFAYDNNTQKPKPWTELNHLLSWTAKFFDEFKENKANFVALELIRGLNELPISLAKHHVDDAINIVAELMNFNLGLDVQHPDTRVQTYAANSILIEDINGVHEILRQIFTCLYSKCVVRLVVKANHFYSAILTNYIVDMMHRSGATKSEISCICFDRRESIGNERFNKCPTPNRASKLSTIAVVFKQTDTFAAAQGIIESYFREQFPNLIILIEESAYERFIQDWQRYYSHALFIGQRLDNRTTVVDSVNERVKIDLAAIDIKAAHKMSGNAINMLKYRNLTELLSLFNSLRKVPYISVWNDDILLSRDFCNKINICNDFWLNHIPKSVACRKLNEDMLNFYSDLVAEDMASIYNSVKAEFNDEVELLRKMQATFMKKDSGLRTRLLVQEFVSLVSRYKSLRNGATIAESLSRLKRSQQLNNYRISTTEINESRIETCLKPVGLAILLIREESAIKSKAALVEFIFKNLLLGNAVLLVCPVNTLVAKFSLENDHIIPFRMVHDSLPDISRLSLDSSIDASDEASNLRKTCPKNTYAMEILPEMTSESFEMVTVALGSRFKNIWLPNTDQTNYWSNNE